MTEAQVWFWLFALVVALFWTPVMVVLVISAKIDALDAKIDAVGSKVDTKIDTLGAKIKARIDTQQEVRSRAFGSRPG